MLNIRSEQLEDLQEPMMAGFITREIKRLDGFHPLDCRPPDAEWIKLKFGEARNYGLDTEADFARYNDLAFEEGDGFPDSADLEILERRDLWGWQKLDQIEARRIFITGHPTT